MPEHDPTIHRFDDSGIAYGESQCSDAIHDGDLLVVEGYGRFGERSVALFMGAWPICLRPGLVTDHDTAFHTTLPGHSVEDAIADYCGQSWVEETPEFYAKALRVGRQLLDQMGVDAGRNRYYEQTAGGDWPEDH